MDFDAKLERLVDAVIETNESTKHAADEVRMNDTLRRLDDIFLRRA